jgi:hypothetical protein
MISIPSLNGLMKMMMILIREMVSLILGISFKYMEEVGLLFCFIILNISFIIRE